MLGEASCLAAQSQLKGGLLSFRGECRGDHRSLHSTSVEIANGKLKEIVGGYEPLNRGLLDLLGEPWQVNLHFPKTVPSAQDAYDLIVLRTRDQPLVGGIWPILPQ